MLCVNVKVMLCGRVKVMLCVRVKVMLCGRVKVMLCVRVKVMLCGRVKVMLWGRVLCEVRKCFHLSNLGIIYTPPHLVTAITSFKINPITQLVNLGDTNVQIRCAAEPGEQCLWRWNFINTTTTGAIEIVDNKTN